MWEFNVSLWEKKYRHQNESSPKETFRRVANVIASTSDEKDRFFEMLVEGRFLPGGRILAYAGTGVPAGTWMNCYTMGDPEDSMESIMKSLSESAMTMKAGGGIGLNFSNLRPKGSPVKKTNSKSSGPVSFMEMWNSMSRTISGVNDRKGAMIAVLNVDHPDIIDFIKAKENNSSNNPVFEKFNLSVGITDKFMNAVIEDKDWVCQFPLQDGQIIEKQYKAKEIMDEIVSFAWAKAEPGVVFLDTVNRFYNLSYTGEKITATNPCVTGDTRILTSKGYVPIKDTIGKPTEIWNGYEWSEVVPFSTGVNDILNIEFSNGVTLKCTPYHKFILADGTRVEAKDLNIGDKLKKYEMPVITDGKEYPVDAYSQGFYAGDGNKNLSSSWIYSAKYCCIDRLKGTVSEKENISNACRYWNHGKMLPKTFVPLDGNITYKLNWLAGLLDSDGCIVKEKKSTSLQITSIDKEFLDNVRLMLTTLGVDAKVTILKLAQWKNMPDSKRQPKLYYTQMCYRLCISHYYTNKLIELGLKCERLDLSNSNPDRNAGRFIYVTKITKGEPQETFCFNEPKNHTGTFEGIVTGQCGEIPMPPYGACNLGSINLVAHVKNPFSMVADFDYDLLLSTIKSAVKFLDNVIDLTPYPTEEHKRNAISSRRIGLGFFGLGSALSMLCLKYGSKEATQKVDELMRFIRDNAYRTSIILAKEKGAFPLFSDKFLESRFIKNLPEDIQESIAQYGIRNSQLLAIAPTGSISQFAGNVSSGIEPIFSLEYKRLNYGQEILVEDYAWSIYKKMYPEATLKEIPEFFVTAHELSWKEHIDTQAICQSYIDGAISKTINLPKEITKEELKDVFIYAWRKGLKGCTIYREGSIDGEVLKKDKDSKKATPGLRQRPYKLESLTYKVKVPDQKHAFYLTFSHSKDTNKNKPIELFINTNDPTVQEWVRALGRLVSAVFRNVEDPTFLIDEFRQIYAPTGFWSGMRRKYIPSLVAEFGEIMEDYFTDIGILDPKVPVEAYEEHTYGYCKICGQYGLVYEEGCVKCLNCGYNKCG